MEQIIKLYCGVWLDCLLDCCWYLLMFVIVVFGLFVCWSNVVGGLIFVQLKVLGWIDNFIIVIFLVIMIVGMFFGVLVGGIIGDKIGCRNVFIFYEVIYIVLMVVGVFLLNMDFFIVCCFVMGVGLGVLLVMLFVGFIEYMFGRNCGMWLSWVFFIGNWLYLFCLLIVMGFMLLISVEWNWWV